jgi:hypothetical protein
MTEFVKGMKVSTVETKYGEIIKLGIKIDEFKQNPVNERGYLNIDILTSQKGTKYAVLNSYKKQEKSATAETIQDEFEGQIVDFADEEINF